MPVREATANDGDAIAAIYDSAFPVEEAPIVGKLALALLDQSLNPGTLAWVAEHEQRLAAHIAFSPLTCLEQPAWRAYLLAPLGVMADQQKRGLGSELIAHGIEHLKAAGIHTLLVYGDPAYYGRFGFSAENAGQFVPPHPLEQPFGWQVLSLNPFTTGKQPLALRCVAALDDAALW